MKLYTITIRGRKYYFFAELTDEAIQASEQFCINLEVNSKTAHHKTLFECFLKYIKTTLGLNVIPVSVEHIFRINY